MKYGGGQEIDEPVVCDVDVGALLDQQRGKVDAVHLHRFMKQRPATLDRPLGASVFIKSCGCKRRRIPSHGGGLVSLLARRSHHDAGLGRIVGLRRLRLQPEGVVEQVGHAFPRLCWPALRQERLERRSINRRLTHCREQFLGTRRGG